MRHIKIGEQKVLVTELTAKYFDILLLCIKETNDALIAHRKENVDIYKTIMEIERAQNRCVARRKKLLNGS